MTIMLAMSQEGILGNLVPVHFGPTNLPEVLPV